MNEDELKSGKIADHIDDLHDNVFDELTKAKIAEIERLREEIGKQIEKDGHAENVKVPDHLDVQNWEKFNKEDLRKLIVRVWLYHELFGITISRFRQLQTWKRLIVNVGKISKNMK